MRFLNLILVGCVVALAVHIYQLKYETEALETRVAELRHAIGQERDAVAVLRAEWSHLNRPERLERLSRKHLGLEPLKAKQVVSAEQAARLVGSSPAEIAARLLGRTGSLAGGSRSSVR